MVARERDLEGSQYPWQDVKKRWSKLKCRKLKRGSKTYIAGMSFESGNEPLRSVIPNLDGPVVASGQEVRLVRLWVVIDRIYTLLLMCLQSETTARSIYVAG